MRVLCAIVGWLMLLSGIALLFVGAVWSNTTSATSNSIGTAEVHEDWTCRQVADRQECAYNGTSPEALQARTAAAAAWTQVGAGLTTGGAVLVGAVLLSAGRTRRASADRVPQQQATQQVPPMPYPGPVASHPHYGQPQG